MSRKRAFLHVYIIIYILYDIIQESEADYTSLLEDILDACALVYFIRKRMLTGIEIAWDSEVSILRDTKRSVTVYFSHEICPYR